MTDKADKRKLLLAAPALMFLTAETVTGNLRYETAPAFLLNLILYELIYLGLLVWFRTTRYGWPVLNLAIYGLAVGEYFVISFRERPAMIWDVLALRTALTVSANYTFAVTPRLVITFLLTAALSFAAWKWPLKLERPGGRALWGIAGAGFFTLLFTVFAPLWKLDVQMWDPIVNFEKEGFLLSTVLSLKSIAPPKPAQWSGEEAGDLAEATRAGELLYGENAAAPEVIIGIMNESFADLRLYNQPEDGRWFETDREVLPYFDSLEENAQKGSLYVPVFGAMTANSEYEFLTGYSCAFLPQGSVPYQFFTKPGDDSLAAILKQAGYRTVAMHPYPGHNWNRNQAYENLGFDEFLDLDDYEAMAEERTPEMPRGYMSDRSDYDGILHVLREKKPGERLFLFNVTMQNHGGYEVEGLTANVHVTKVNGQACEGSYPKADQYLTLMRMSDEALGYLLDELSGYEEKVMVILFGDHQPSVETGLFEALFGTRWSEAPGEKKIHAFETPYLIWTNYERDADPLGDMSAFMLGNEAVKAAGLIPTGHRAAAEELRSDYAAVHSMGVLRRNGVFEDADQLGGLDADPGIRAFHILQYDDIFK